MFDLDSVFSTNSAVLKIVFDVGLLFLFAFIVYYIARALFAYIISRLSRNKSSFICTLANPNVIKKIVRIIPWFIIQLGIGVIPDLPVVLMQIIRNVAMAVTILSGMLALITYINAIIDYFSKKDDLRMRSIKSYAQLIQLIVFILGTICVIAVLIDRSPAILLSGLGAMSAITMLIFKDTILSFVAGVQLSSNDILRVGDWIEMPQVGADGDVIDIALQIVKVQNWDKTIVSIPTWRFMQESFKNWRGMQESGGRRITRSLSLDISSVRFLLDDDIERLKRIRILKTYLSNKQSEIDTHNRQLGQDEEMTVNQRHLTNIGTFRAYVQAYLRSHSGINQSMTCMVRQLAPTPEGLPIQLYCFTSTIAWAEYENIQSDIFDHLFSILPEFGLSAYQKPSGRNFSMLFSNTTKQ